MEISNLLNRTNIIYESLDRGSSLEEPEIASYHFRGFFSVDGVTISF